MPTVEEAVDTWLLGLSRSVKMGNISPRTESNYREGITFALSHLSANGPLESVTSEQLDSLIDIYAELPDQRFRDPQKNGEKALSSISRLHSTLSVFFNDAQRRGWITISPIVGTYLARGKTTRTSDPKRKSVGLEGATALLQNELSCRDEFIIRVLLEAGPRVGELCASDQGDLVFDDITESWWLNLLHTKNGKERKIPITNDLLALYEKYRANEMRPAARRPKEAGVSVDAETALLRTSRGRRITPRDIQNLLNRACRGTGMRVTPHGLRHTSATVLLESGTDLHVVRDLLGHSSVSVTSAYLDSADVNVSRAVRSSPLAQAGRKGSGTGIRAEDR